MTPSRTPTGRELQLQMIPDALRTFFPGAAARLTIDKVEQLVSAIVALVLGYYAKWKAVGDSHAAYQDAMKERKKVEPEVRAFLRHLHETLKPLLGADSAALLKFGYKPAREQRQLTQLEGLHKVELANATRKERHTMGKRQKKNIKGTLPQNNNGGAANGGPANGGPSKA